MTQNGPQPSPSALDPLRVSFEAESSAAEFGSLHFENLENGPRSGVLNRWFEYVLVGFSHLLVCFAMFCQYCLNQMMKNHPSKLAGLSYEKRLFEGFLPFWDIRLEIKFPGSLDGHPARNFGIQESSQAFSD